MLHSSLRPALVATMVIFAFFSLLTGLAYPLLVTGIAQAAFADRANGSLIVTAGEPVGSTPRGSIPRGSTPRGSTLIGQHFTGPEYFWGRPSATGTRPYNALASGGSNQGPLNPAWLDAVKMRIDTLRAADPANTASIPVDLVTASASGLDPHISVAAAKYQTARVARARNLPVTTMQSLVAKHTRGRWLGIFGEPRVNVLELNLALDALALDATR